MIRIARRQGGEVSYTFLKWSTVETTPMKQHRLSKTTKLYQDTGNTKYPRLNISVPSQSGDTHFRETSTTSVSIVVKQFEELGMRAYGQAACCLTVSSLVKLGKHSFRCARRFCAKERIDRMRVRTIKAMTQEVDRPVMGNTFRRRYIVTPQAAVIKNVRTRSVTTKVSKAFMLAISKGFAIYVRVADLS